jgi:hypothetical protein
MDPLHYNSSWTVRGFALMLLALALTLFAPPADQSPLQAASATPAADERRAASPLPSASQPR